MHETNDVPTVAANGKADDAATLIARIPSFVMREVRRHIEEVQSVADSVARWRYMGKKFIGDEWRYVGEYLEQRRPMHAPTRKFFQTFLRICREKGIDGNAVLRQELIQLRKERNWSRERIFRGLQGLR